MKRLVENGLKGGCVVAGLETDDEIRVARVNGRRTYARAVGPSLAALPA